MSPRWTALTLALAAAASAAPAAAFCRSTTCTSHCEVDENGCKTTGLRLAWTSGCVGISLSKKGTTLLPMNEVRRVLTASLATWSALDCPAGPASIGYRQLADVACTAAAYNEEGANANVVLFRDDDWPYQGTDNTLAFTTVTFDPPTGNILGADIEINTAYNVLTTADTGVVYDLQAILTHELGHGLGLGHSSDPTATMNAVYERGDIAIRALAPDDIAGICAAYPPGRKAACDPTPHGGFLTECAVAAPEFGTKKRACALAPGPAGGGAPLVAMGFGVVIARLRKRSWRGIGPAR